jgi:hypothetical protein
MSMLLALPDACLLAVLQFCSAQDQQSLFSAARAHSRLHQASLLALTRLTIEDADQDSLDSMLLFLAQHGQHMDSITIKGAAGVTVRLRHLPPHLQIKNLRLSSLRVQMQPGNGFAGVLGAAAGAAALKQLQLTNCWVLDDDGRAYGLVPALSQLPAGLEHLSFQSDGFSGRMRDKYGGQLFFPAGVLQQVQQLTYLDLGGIALRAPNDPIARALQPLQGMMRLADLRLGGASAANGRTIISAAMLSDLQHLTRLKLSNAMALEPGALAGKTQLQHLDLCTFPFGRGEAAKAACSELLSHLQPLQQLTHLRMYRMLLAYKSDTPASAFAALTASSKLQHLDISSCILPAGVWQHMFPAGRQWLSLQEINIDRVKLATALDSRFCYGFPAPEGLRLVSCCPSLRCLRMMYLQCSAELLVSLQGLRGLQTLRLGCADSSLVQALCQLTGLRELWVMDAQGVMQQGAHAVLLDLTQLKHLTKRYYAGHRFAMHSGPHTISSSSELKAGALKTRYAYPTAAWVFVL